MFNFMVINELLRASQKTQRNRLFQMGFFIFLTLLLANTERNSTFYPYYILSFFMLYFLDALAFSDRQGLHNNLNLTYREQVNSYYIFTSLLPFFFFIMNIVFVTIFGITEEPLISYLIKITTLFIPYVIMTLFHFHKSISQKVVTPLAALGFSGTILWLFFTVMKIQGNVAYFVIEDFSFTINPWLVLILVYLIYLLYVFIVSRISIKLYTPKLPDGI